jgi:transcription factor SPN1
MDDPDLDPIDETAKPDLSDSELSDVDEEAYAGIDTNRIGLDSDDEGPNVFALKPAKLKTGTGERRKKRDGGNEEERRRIRQERRLQKEPKRRISDSVPDDLPEQPDPNARPEDPEAARRWDLDHAMEAAIARKPVKRRKKDDDEFVCSLSSALTQDLDTLEAEQIKTLKSAMEQAADKDFDAITHKQPATHKLAMLPTVDAILAKSALHEVILDQLLLITIRRWLEPLPDRSLPAYSIQRTLLTALQKLPVTKEHLAESGVGKIVIFYRNSPRVEQPIRRIADALWVEWSRPILRKSANFRDRQIATASYNASMQLPVLKQSNGEEPRRTVIPHTIHSTFEIAPRATLEMPASRGVRTDNDMFKRLKMKVQSKSVKAKKEGGVSIQGGAR